MTLLHQARLAVQLLGLDVCRMSGSYDSRRSTWLERLGITLVLDVGASTGQYVRRLRRFGYSGRIVSFEPIPDDFKQLRARYSGDPLWRGYNVALADKSGVVKFHLSEDRLCSSILSGTELLTTSLPGARTVEVFNVETRSLDSIWDELAVGEAITMLKMDVQGYEQYVLRGAETALSSVAAIELEVGMVPVYSGGSEIYGLLPQLHARGFRVGAIQEGHVDEVTKQLLDADLFMHRLHST